MTKLRYTTIIARPLPEVWDYVLDSRHNPVWMTFVLGVGRGADQPVELGREIEEITRFLGVEVPVTLTITEHEPMRRSRMRITGGPIPGRGTYEFESVDGGTRFTMAMELDGHLFFKLAEPVFARLARRQVVASAGQLKDLLESSAATRNDSRTYAA